MTQGSLRCPSCGGVLLDDPPGSSLRCPTCPWRLISREEWLQLSPLQQGYALYMQAAWPTSELAGATNPYPEGSKKWKAFQQGELRAALAAQDGEE